VAVLQPEVHAYYLRTGFLGYLSRPYRPEAVEIRRIQQADLSWKWMVKEPGIEGGAVLNRLLEWEYQSSPSNRTTDDLQRTRYVSMEEALQYVGWWIEHVVYGCTHPPACERCNWCGWRKT
jgi:hypothetical protein